MRPLQRFFHTLAILLLVPALLGGCSSAGSADPIAPSTVTPLASIPAATTPEAVTATPPAGVVIGDVPEVIEARQKISEGNYDRAVQLLRRVTVRYAESSDAREELAIAYQEWGSSLVESSDGDIQQIILGLDKFTSGLAVAPFNGGAQNDLQRGYDDARAYVDAAVAQDVLVGNGESLEIAVRRGEAARISEIFKDLYARSPEFPGLVRRYALALLAAGTSYSEGGTSTEEKISLREQARAYCEQALTINPALSEAEACAEDAAESIVLLSATPTPVVTRAPSRLAMTKINQDERPGCISVQLRNVNAAGWKLTIDGMNMTAQFDGANNSSLCGLPSNSITFTIINTAGSSVPGGSGIPANGGDIFIGNWK